MKSPRALLMKRGSPSYIKKITKIEKKKKKNDEEIVQLDTIPSTKIIVLNVD